MDTRSSRPDSVESSFLEGLGSYLRTRFELVSLETLEAAHHYRDKIYPVLIALVCVIGSYLLLLAALVSWLGKILQALGKSVLLGWEMAAVIVAGLHILTLFLMKKALFRKPKAPLYEYTRSELAQDRIWLEENTRKKTN